MIMRISCSHVFFIPKLVHQSNKHFITIKILKVSSLHCEALFLMIGCDIAVRVIHPCSRSLLDKLMKQWSIPENLLDKPFLSPQEISELLGVSVASIYRLIDARKLAAFKIGNSLRVLKEDMIEYLKSQRIDLVL